MKKVVIFVIVIFQGCVLLKYAPLTLNNAYYVSEKGPMVGNSTLLFDDSTFVYTERGDLFEGKGKWTLSPNGKILILECTIKSQNGDMNLEQHRYFELRIRGKDKLVGDADIFIRKQ